jgi:tetratricopeptide (TPR) repeat protein
MKFKNIKKKPVKNNKSPLKTSPRKNKIKLKESIQVFPSNSRFIPEFNFLVPKLQVNLDFKSHKIYFFMLSLIFVAVCLLGIIYFSVNVYKDGNKLIMLYANREELQSKINFWKSIADKYEGYKDAYFMIANLSYQLGDTRNAKIYNNKALLLDPNYLDAKKLDMILQKQ